MTPKLLISIAMLAFAASAPMSAPPRAPAVPTATPAIESNKIQGDYVEARTASVFAGACHYNAELVTTGRDAIIAWNIASGSWNKTNLAGLRAMAAVTSDANLGNESAARKSELTIDPIATPAQVKAFQDFVQSQAGHELGTITKVRQSPVTFTRTGRAYDVTSPNFATLSVQPMPNDDCCTQPNLVWYKPLIQLEHRKVGFTINAAYTAATLGDPWQQAGDNSAFYGSFSF
jgi:hypothetical protein